MFSKVWDLVIGWLKSRSYWSTVEPFVLIVLGWAAAELYSFQWMATGAFSPPIELFAQSYLSKRITVAAIALAALVLLFRWGKGQGVTPMAGRFRAFWATNQRLIAYRLIGSVAIIALAALGFRLYSPAPVNHIKVRFMDLGADVTEEGLAYLIYELNRLQQHWYFEIDFTPFNEEQLKSSQAEECRADERPKLCQAEVLAEGKPFIGITAQDLGGAFFAEHQRNVSVITTFERKDYEPLTSYEYLAYCLILESMAIHLDVQDGLPSHAFREGRDSYGGLFQFVPIKRAIKSSILAARLTPQEEVLLLNRFGRDYVATCSSLLTMEWLYSERVRGNFERAFGTKLAR